jgi:hypothetical protein
MGSVQLFVGLREELLAGRKHCLLVGWVGQLVDLAIGGAVGEVAIVATDLLDCRVSEELIELVSDPTDVLDKPLHSRGRVCKRFKVIVASHGGLLERLYFVLDQLTDLDGVDDGAA